jgi:poly(A) polymerase
LAWGVLLHDVGKPPTFSVTDRIRFNGHAEVGTDMARGILTRLRASSDVIRKVQALVAHHLRFKDTPRMRESTLKRFLRMEDFAEHMELHRLDCAASHGLLGNYEFVRSKWKEMSEEQLRPPRLITGHDLIRAGYPAGPVLGRILESLETAQLEGRIAGAQEALDWVRSEFGPPPGDG